MNKKPTLVKQTLSHRSVSSLALAVGALIVCPALVHAQSAEGPKYQFPTLTRVEYVQDCIRAYPNVSAREMTYKCACAIDSIANDISHDEFVDLSTVTSAISIAGERGAAIREQKASRPMANKFRDLQTKAKKACFIND
jgi:hypothetical protein